MKTVNSPRGDRIKKAMSLRGHSKLLGLAAELDVSVVAISKWISGKPVALENACALAEALNVSLDWLLLNRGSPEWHLGDQITEEELRMVFLLRNRSEKLRFLLQDLITEVAQST